MCLEIARLQINSPFEMRNGLFIFACSVKEPAQCRLGPRTDRIKLFSAAAFPDRLVVSSKSHEQVTIVQMYIMAARIEFQRPLHLLIRAFRMPVKLVFDIV